MPTPVVLTAGLVASAVGGSIQAGSADAVFASVSTDTRTVETGALFVALRGDRFDGHDFLEDAKAGGATGLIVSTVPREAMGVTVIEVADTLVALQRLARAIRHLSGTRVVAITGSAGKTTTKEVTADLLSIRYRVFRNRGNLNNHIGLPLSLIELRHAPEVAVVELGMNHAGEISTLVALARPDVCVWTNVGDAHIGHFGSVEAIARAKAEIFEGATPSTVAVVNADDPLVMAHSQAFAGRRLTFGESAVADVRATAVRDRGFDGVTATIHTPVGEAAIEVALPGRPHLQNVLAAIAVATHFDVPIAAIAATVSRIAPVARRGRSTTNARGVRVVDESYNASPAAVRASLAVLAATPAAGRRIAVLGEMLELGEEARALHAECGRRAAAVVDLLVVVGGPSAEALAAGAADAGLAQTAIHRAGDSTVAAEIVIALARPGDVVLVKGSRGVRTDIVADRLAEAA